MRKVDGRLKRILKRDAATGEKRQVTLSEPFTIPIGGSENLFNVCFQQVSYQRLTFTEAFNITVFHFCPLT